MFEKLCLGALVAFVFWHPATVDATEAVPVPLPQLPATFSGSLPCANCEGIQTSITLQADGTFFSRQLYVGEAAPNQANDLGRWVMSHHGNIVVTQGQSSEQRYFRVKSADSIEMLDLEARTIFSTLNYSLNRNPTAETLDLKLFPLNGLYRYFADAGRFTECATGVDLPVLTMGDNATLEKAYLQLRAEPGQALLATVYGHIKPAPAMEGPNNTLSLHPLRFENIAKGDCAPRLYSASLKDQFWTLVQLKGKPVVLPESGRAPGLMLHTDNSRLSGSGGCNQLLGSYSLEGSLVQLNMVAATRMACLSPGNVDAELIETLTQVKSWNILGQRMELYDQLGRLLARFEVR
jgi:copper homeostasis protein (lipoprotein)